MRVVSVKLTTQQALEAAIRASGDSQNLISTLPTSMVFNGAVESAMITFMFAINWHPAEYFRYRHQTTNAGNYSYFA